ncbi:adenosylmethionine--8-amino-7-oxononanoate transaminase [Neorickettsia sennetsu]|uniref:Adenosylmethionine-8-amino-7-oxononanoate aminotransferase n=1 Tax=Ehrlichia sennetsu (strain ATCC VR-367 / Miyayama) TaxID=222891 RepID=Q2GDE8_EHRS3|nr:adenosylmethionine--8-amino-7-oxononanoate transaminase [Neorickettsia sennetsu]ABD45661.1 adenosylmethionine-8-amino-7-oxononanoate aminotransferase [Neorickettsia sennetsu str. Miyayama]
MYQHNKTVNLSVRDKSLIWHPLTQEKTSSPSIAIIRGEGEYLYDEQNKKYLDLISSWWVNLHGHANPAIAHAIYEQALKLEQVIFAGFTHDQAIQLCENLKVELPENLTRFFFSDNGSTSVEVALKIALQFWKNSGEKQRDIFISFDKGYHGDTVGAMSLGASSGFFDQYKKILFETVHVPFPATWENDPDVEIKEEASLNTIQNFLEQNLNRVAGFIAEPLVQGAGGMRMCRYKYLEQCVKLFKEYGILTIFDEIMTGFYRTGKMFASDYILSKPDILCLSKGLTGGFLPLSLTITTERVYNAFLSDNFSSALIHSHSYTGNPLGCAAAIASLELLKSTSTLDKIAKIEQLHRSFICDLKLTLPEIIKAERVCGTIVAFNLFSEECNYNHTIAVKLREIFMKEGLLIRPLGNTIYLMPPYCISEKALKEAHCKVMELISSIAGSFT